MRILSSDLPSPLSRDQWERVAPTLKLRRSETQVVGCLMRGFTDKQICSELHIKRPTVRTHMRRIFDQLGACTRTEVVFRVCAKARELAIIQVD